EASQSQRQITDFFRAATGHSEELLSQQSSSPNTRGTLIDRATELGRSRRPRLRRTTQHRRRLHQRIQITLARHAQCPVKLLTMEEIDEIRQRPMLDLL
ncbi:hypothetical protein DD606_26365, partial [Enterobacter cloacae complex sp. GF14B]